MWLRLTNQSKKCIKKEDPHRSPALENTGVLSINIVPQRVPQRMLQQADFGIIWYEHQNPSKR